MWVTVDSSVFLFIQVNSLLTLGGGKPGTDREEKLRHHCFMRLTMARRISGPRPSPSRSAADAGAGFRPSPGPTQIMPRIFKVFARSRPRETPPSTTQDGASRGAALSD